MLTLDALAPAPAPTRAPAGGSPFVLTLTGEIDVATAVAVRSALRASFDEGHRDVVVDLTGVSFIDAAGLGVLVGAQRRFARAGGRLRVEHPQRSVRRVLEITALDRVLGL